MSSIIKVDTVQDTDGNNIINENANTITIGASGDTITIPSGATITNNGTQTGFGREGSVDWQTGSIKTSTFTAVSGEGYFINQGSAITANLPAGSAGAIVAFADYARNFATYNFTISPNGSEKIGGIAADLVLDVNGQALTLVYVDSTKGWINVQNAEDTEKGQTSYSADYLVIGGGGGGGRAGGGGGGAGGYRNSYASEDSGGGGSSESSLTFEIGTVYTITVGDGGAGAPTGSPGFRGTSGNDSSISGSGITTITSTGGGGGGGNNASSPGRNGAAGGSGGGGCGNGSPAGSGGNGTTNQGFAGGAGSNGSGQQGAGGGGGSDAAGAAGTSSAGGAGGNGNASSITGSSVTRAGGGGGGGYDSLPGGAGGSGGGGAGNTGSNGAATVGTANTGGGGGGAHDVAAAAGGKGVVILRVPTSSYSGTTTGSPTVTTSGSDTVMVFNATGSYTG
jgi:hypothetical protein